MSFLRRLLALFLPLCLQASRAPAAVRVRSRASRRALLALAAALATLAPARAQEFLEDPDYRFRIARPGAGWKLLDEAEIRRVNPDAIAGLTDLGSLNFMVVVEAAPGGELDGFVDVVRDGIALEDKELGRVAQSTFHDLPARTWDTTGRTSGMDFRFRHLVFVREDFLFQLIGYTLEGPAPRGRAKPDLDALRDHFSFLPGPLRARAVAREGGDRDGVGWRVRDGVYQDAANGVEVRPPAGWRLALGAELEQMNDSACVGLVASDPEAYFVLIVERAAGVHEAAYRAQVALDLGPDMEMGEPVVREVAGLAFPIARLEAGSSLPLVFHHGVRVHDGLGVQVLAWCVTGLEARAQPLFESAFGSIRWLPAQERAQLAAELAARRDPENVVGESFALRAGTYRDFTAKFTWTKPAGFWQLDVGEQARAVNPDATLSFEAPETGINGLLIVEPGYDGGLADFHAAVVDGLEPTRSPSAPLSFEIDGVPALRSSVRARAGELDFAYDVLTAVHRGRAFQLLVWTIAGNEPGARKGMSAALAGLRFPEKLVEREKSRDGLVDLRLGFRLKKPPGPDWKLEGATPAEVSSICSLSQYSSPHASAMGGAICVTVPGEDGRTLRDLMLAGMAKRMGLDGAPAEETDALLAGLPAKRVVLRGEIVLVAYTAQRDATHYLAVIGIDPAHAVVTEAELLATFELID